jgi:hypothetical protein
MARLFKNLRLVMREYDLTNELLGREIGCSPGTISNKLNGHFPWTSEEMWKIMELTNQPAHKLHDIFPRHGLSEEGTRRTRNRSA